nr:hypothetical protein [Tanacetum cinerariifolium]
MLGMKVKGVVMLLGLGRLEQIDQNDEDADLAKERELLAS